jgi:hypothetical protein
MHKLDPAAAGPEWKTLIPAIGDRPAVRVAFAPVGPKALRQARRAVAEILRTGGPDAMEDAGDAFTQALIRAGIRAWEGIGNLAGEIVAPTHDVEHRDEDGALLRVEPGTISLFLADARLVEAADREYVLPWTRLDAEKNGYAPSPDGISARATAAPDIAGSPATPDGTAVAGNAPTKSSSPRRKRAKRSGN